MWKKPLKDPKFWKNTGIIIVSCVEDCSISDKVGCERGEPPVTSMRKAVEKSLKELWMKLIREWRKKARYCFEDTKDENKSSAKYSPLQLIARI